MDRQPPASPLEGISAAILVGGLGTRLQSVVADRPKALAEVSGRPFLSYLLDQLALAGLRDVVLCTGHMAGLVEAAFGRQYAGLTLHYSPEPVPLGTAGALRLACPLLGRGTTLILNGDSYCAADLAGFVRWHGRRGAPASLLLAQVADASRFGRVQVDGAGRVRAFEEKGSSGSGWINAGIYAVERDLLETIPAGRPVSLEREVFPAWLSQRLDAMQCQSPLLDIGTPQSYAAAQTFFSRHSRTGRSSTLCIPSSTR